MDEKNTTKIRIRVGAAEVEFEGDGENASATVLDLLQKALELAPAATAADQAASRGESSGGSALARPPSPPGGRATASTSMIAARLGVASATDLAKAAAGHLGVVQEKSTFARSELLTAMQSAPEFYKTTMRGNLSATLGTLVKQKWLNNVAKDTFSLSAAARSEMEGAVANAS